MNKLLRVTLLTAVCAASAVLLHGCGGSPATSSVTLVPAPPGPTDLGPAVGLSTPPAGAIVFDLKYRAQTGGADDIPYNSYWGYGGPSEEETRADPFLQDVRKRTSRLHYVSNNSLKGRKWAAVEYHDRQALAFYFDLDADGKLAENERISPTRKTADGFEFITPDFFHPSKGDDRKLCRALLRVDFYEGSSEPDCMWSPATLLEGTATLNGRPARLLLFASNLGGEFDDYGSSQYSLLLGDEAKPAPGQYVEREALSSLVPNENQFYRLSIEGRRSNGLPARVLLVKDTSPTGTLAVKLAGSNSLQTMLSTLDLHGVDNKTVFFRVGAAKGKVTLPVGAYSLERGLLSYGATNARDWEVSFSKGPCATIRAGESFEQALGQPTLIVRAVKENDRYNQKAVESTVFKQGTRIYLEPRIIGKNQEVFSRFRQPAAGRGNKGDRAPRITITGPDGKQLLSKVMEYG